MPRGSLKRSCNAHEPRSAISCFKVTLETSANSYTLEHLHAVRGISHDEESIRVGQVVIYYITLRNHSHVTDRVDVVVCSTYTQSRLQDAISSELKLFRNNKLSALNCDFQATLVSEGSNVNQSLFQRSLGKVCCSCQLISQIRTAKSRVICCTERLAVSTKRCGESVVQDVSSFNLLSGGLLRAKALV